MCLGPDIFIRYRCVPRGTILAGAILLGQVVRHSVFWCNDHHLVTEKSSTRQSPPKFHQAPTPPVQRHPHVTRKPKSASLHSSQEGGSDRAYAGRQHGANSAYQPVWTHRPQDASSGQLLLFLQHVANTISCSLLHVTAVDQIF